jgi:hypothetical protein
VSRWVLPCYAMCDESYSMVDHLATPHAISLSAATESGPPEPGSTALTRAV